MTPNTTKRSVGAPCIDPTGKQRFTAANESDVGRAIGATSCLDRNPGKAFRAVFRVVGAAEHTRCLLDELRFSLGELVRTYLIACRQLRQGLLALDRLQCDLGLEFGAVVSSRSSHCCFAPLLSGSPAMGQSLHLSHCPKNRDHLSLEINDGTSKSVPSRFYSSALVEPSACSSRRSATKNRNRNCTRQGQVLFITGKNW